jgi:polysaccharide pyruvyl transferase WcaK-like protein
VNWKVRVANNRLIGLVGFFGWGNFGDELFVETYKQHLEPYFQVEVVHDLLEKPYFSRPIDEVVEKYDALVIGGGDLVIPWQLSGLYWRFEYLKKPTFVHSVGVPTWGKYDRSVVEELRRFFSSDAVKQVSARDPESARWIQKHLKAPQAVQHAPDMVCALNLPPAIKPLEPVLGIVTRYRRGGEDDYSQLQVLCEKAASLGFKIRHLVLATGVTGERDLMAADQFNFPGKQIVSSESVWDLCQAIGECSVLASMKFHGSVVAAMYGVPSIVLSPTDKSRNFMRQLERLDLLSNLNDPNLSDHFGPYMAPIPVATREMLTIRAKQAMDDLKYGIQSALAGAT